MKVTLTKSRVEQEKVTVELEPVVGTTRHPEWMVFLGDEHIGNVRKGEHTYSPRAAGHGGRIARYHTQVTHWESSLNGIHWDTRADAIRALLRNVEAV